MTLWTGKRSKAEKRMRLAKGKRKNNVKVLDEMLIHITRKGTGQRKKKKSTGYKKEEVLDRD